MWMSCNWKVERGCMDLMKRNKAKLDEMTKVNTNCQNKESHEKLF